jgi:hypothetical protein
MSYPGRWEKRIDNTGENSTQISFEEGNIRTSVVFFRRIRINMRPNNRGRAPRKEKLINKILGIGPVLVTVSVVFPLSRYNAWLMKTDTVGD